MSGPLVFGNARRGGRWWRLALWLAITAGLVTGGMGLWLYGALAVVSPPVPSAESLLAERPTRFHARDGRLVAELGTDWRTPVPLRTVPAHVVAAFLAAEDQRFFRHGGVDWWGTARAALANLTAGRTVQGASTLTQQLCKRQVGRDRTWDRKLREAILARRTEHVRTKVEILELYLNSVYLGHGAYGVEAAAQRYFGKSAASLTLAEGALLAGVPPRPGQRNPVVDPDGSRARRTWVLRRMVAEGFITPEASARADGEPLGVSPAPAVFRTEAPHYVEHARRLLADSEPLATAGLRVHLALDVDAQAAARGALRTAVRRLGRRQGYTGPLARLPPAARPAFRAALAPGVPVGLVEAVSTGAARVRLGDGLRQWTLDDLGWASPWTRSARRNNAPQTDLTTVLTPGDVVFTPGGRLATRPPIEAAWLALEPRTGAVTALVGGVDYDRSQYNRVFQGCRQPGSVFKPFIYGLALDATHTLASLLDDTPLVRGQGDFLWKPNNAGRYAGDVLLHTAIVASKNVPAVRLLETLGPARVARFARVLGITTPLDPTPALALGSGCVHPWDLVLAFAVFAEDGRAARPAVITRVDGPDGRRFARTHPADPWAPTAARLDGLLRRLFDPPTQVIDAQTAYLVRHALRGVVRSGTGSGARRLGRPTAGKTGTTDAYDAWFVGFTRERLAGLWIGSDDNSRPLGSGETGAWLAAPAWVAALAPALEGLPHQALLADPPPGIEWVSVDVGTGQRAPPGNPSLHLPFKSGTQPTAVAPVVRNVDPRDTDHVETGF